MEADVAIVDRALTLDDPESVGFSRERLQRIRAFIERDVAAQIVPGAVVTVVRHGRTVYQEAIGERDPSTGSKMTLDTIFRIYSMTKPVTSVAAMMLVEEGLLRLDEPVSTYLPFFAEQKVGLEKNGRLELVAPPLPMTVHDLMRHTSGITYGLFGEGLVKQAYRDNGVIDGDCDNATFAERVARQPLAYAPGTVWEYSHSTDILGRIIEVISGESLGAFFRRRIFAPLGMVDTAFHLSSQEQIDRLAEPFPDDREIGLDTQITNPRVALRFESGGGGLVSTASDYGRFTRMLLAGGALEGTRYLGPRTLAFMTSNHIGPGTGVVPGPMYLPGPGFGFGLGFGVRITAGGAPFPGSVGEFNWGGVAGTYFWIDRAEDLIAILLIQAPKYRQRYRGFMKNLVYASLVE